jgi:hypothetical protein
MSAIIPSDRSKLDAIKAKVRRTRVAKGRLIIGLETISRASTIQSWMSDLAYTTQVLVGQLTSPWLNRLDDIKKWGQQCRAPGFTKIADVARHTIETADEYPGERITMMIIGDCFNQHPDELYSYAPCFGRVVFE